MLKDVKTMLTAYKKELFLFYYSHYYATLQLFLQSKM